MTKIITAMLLLVTLAVTSCAEKQTPHKLTTSAPGDNAAPSTTSW
jgi:hypothetical protein